MGTINNKNGITLVELIIGLIIGAIIILMVGVLATTSNRSFERNRQQAEIYADIGYGIKLYQNKVHGAKSLSTIPISASAPQWVSERIVIDNESVFGIYQPNGTTREFVYVKDKTNESDRDIIFSVSAPAVSSIDLTLNITNATATYVEFRIAGKKYGIDFQMRTSASRRNLL